MPLSEAHQNDFVFQFIFFLIFLFLGIIGGVVGILINGLLVYGAKKKNENALLVWIVLGNFGNLHSKSILFFQSNAVSAKVVIEC